LPKLSGKTAVITGASEVMHVCRRTRIVSQDVGMRMGSLG